MASLVFTAAEAAALREATERLIRGVGDGGNDEEPAPPRDGPGERKRRRSALEAPDRSSGSSAPGRPDP